MKGYLFLHRWSVVALMGGVTLVSYVAQSTFAQLVPLTWTFQNTTELLETDTTLTTYTCDPTKTTCRVNLLFSDIRPSPKTQHTCLIDFGFSTETRLNDCNPNQVSVPVGTWPVKVTVIHTESNTIIQELQPLTIINADPAGSGGGISSSAGIDPTQVTSAIEWQSPTYLLAKEDATLSEYTCDPTQTECKINLNILPKIAGAESSLLTCQVVTDFDLVPTTDPCNPNTSLVPTGDHVIEMKILEKSTSAILMTTTLTLKNSPPQPLDPTRVTLDLTWQNTTYLLEKEDTSKTLYMCDPAKPECKINLLITPKLDGVESNQLTCEIGADFGLIATDDPCNPNTSIVPVGDHMIEIKILEASTHTLLTTRSVTLSVVAPTTPPPPTTTSGTSSSADASSPSTNTSPASSGGGGIAPSFDTSQIRIVVQSGLDTSYRCTTEMCTANFLAEVPEGAVCRWDFGGGTFETVDTDKKCNPGYVKFPHDATVILTVQDASLSQTVTQQIQVTRTVVSGGGGGAGTAQPLTAVITLQGKVGANKRLLTQGLLCALDGREMCSVNLTADESIGAQSWYWDFGDGTSSTQKNPPAHDYSPGTYTVRLRAMSEGRTAETQYSVEVTKDFKEILPLATPCPTCAQAAGHIQISAVLANPPHADTTEWIEITNISSTDVQMNGCQLSDLSRAHDLTGVIPAGQTIRLRQSLTRLNLGNSSETLQIRCGETLVDTFAWDITLPTSYILRREVLYPLPQRTIVERVVDGDTVELSLDGKTTKLRLLGIDTPETVHPKKEVQFFGLEASAFTKKTLEGREVWVTFDADPIDHYGRRLGYVWLCPGSFSTSCTLFNAQILSAGYARMERRFGFRLYDDFSDRESLAKKDKKGLWAESEVAKLMNQITRDEKEAVTQEQEKEYLEEQEKLVEECVEGEGENCESSWVSTTRAMSTLSARMDTRERMQISGRTWPHFPVKIMVKKGDNILFETLLVSDSLGEYETDFLPTEIGDVTVSALFAQDDMLVTQTKDISITEISTHLATPLIAHIIPQGKLSKNRWMDASIFHCRSREICSINLTAESNRESDVSYLWILPDGDMTDAKNPPSFRFPYGRHEIILVATDDITGEVVTETFTLDHRAIPRAIKKTNKSPSTKYTLDLKDVSQDVGGGAVPEESTQTPVHILALSVTMILILMGQVIRMLFVRRRRA